MQFYCSRLLLPLVVNLCLITPSLTFKIFFLDKVICYYASWAVTRPGNGKFVPEDIDPNLCTHVNYAFLGLNDDGSLQVLDEENDINQGKIGLRTSWFLSLKILGGLKRVSALKEVNPDLKVLLSIGGAAADTGVFSTVASSPEKRDAMAKSAIEFFETYGFDGLDVDWEYPGGGDIETYVELLSALKTAFEPKGYLVTVAVNSIPGEVGGYDIAAMSKYFCQRHGYFSKLNQMF